MGALFLFALTSPCGLAWWANESPRSAGGPPARPRAAEPAALPAVIIFAAAHRHLRQSADVPLTGTLQLGILSARSSPPAEKTTCTPVGLRGGRNVRLFAVILTLKRLPFRCFTKVAVSPFDPTQLIRELVSAMHRGAGNVMTSFPVRPAPLTATTSPSARAASSPPKSAGSRSARMRIEAFGLFPDAAFNRTRLSTNAEEVPSHTSPAPFPFPSLWAGLKWVCDKFVGN